MLEEHGKIPSVTLQRWTLEARAMWDKALKESSKTCATDSTEIAGRDSLADKIHAVTVASLPKVARLEVDERQPTAGHAGHHGRTRAQPYVSGTGIVGQHDVGIRRSRRRQSAGDIHPRRRLFRSMVFLGLLAINEAVE